MDLQQRKARLIEDLKSQGFLKSPGVIAAFEKVPREKFVPANLKSHAYYNEPLPIAEGQTISQPLTVAAMTEALDAREGHRVLEVGAGSGYQAAILAEVVGPKGKVVTTERLAKLAQIARDNLAAAGFKSVEVVQWDGSKGYETYAPYDRILVAASAPKIPGPLVEQLKEGGKMVIPVGQEMYIVEKTAEGIKKKLLGYYAFVPLVGERGYFA